jgi:hypothetical protein
MKICIKRLFVTSITVAVFGCGQTTTSAENSANNKAVTDSAGSKTGVDSNTNSNVAVSTSLEDCKKLNGIVFQFNPEGISNDLTFTMIFECKNDSLKGLMFGPDPEGEEGTYYFMTYLNNLAVIDNTISFNFAYGDLYKKPFTLDNYYKDFPNKVLGGSNSIMYYKGKLAGDSIVLNCDSPDGGGVCYDKTMVFHKK